MQRQGKELQDHRCWAGSSRSPGMGILAPSQWMKCRGLRASREAEGLSSVCKCPNSPRAATHAVCRMNHVLTERIPATLEGFADVFQVTLGEKNHTQPRFLLPWQPVHRWRKGGQDPSGSLRAPAPHTGPGDAGGRKGGCQGSSWDGADGRKARGDGWLLLILAGRQAGKGDNAGRQHLLSFIFVLIFPQCKIRRGFCRSKRQEAGSVKQGFNMNTHSLESRGLLPGCIPCCSGLWLQKSLGWNPRPVDGYRSHF